MDVDTKAEEENSRRVQVRFITKLKPPLKVAPTSIAIPSNLTRLGLSSLVNNLIQATTPDWNPQPFDFLIDGELVRMSLDNFLLAKAISAEKILEIEYIKAVAPTKHEEPSFHDDWVSALDGSDPRYSIFHNLRIFILFFKVLGVDFDVCFGRFIVTGCYDGLARLLYKDLFFFWLN